MKFKFGLLAILILGIISISACTSQTTSVGGLGRIQGYLFELKGEYYLVEDIPGQSEWKPPIELIGVWTQDEIRQYTQNEEVYPTTTTPAPDFFENVRDAANEKLQQKISELINQYEKFDMGKCISDFENDPQAVTHTSWEEVCENKKETIKENYMQLQEANLDVRLIHDSTANIADIFVMAVKDGNYRWSCYVNPSDYSVSDWNVIQSKEIPILTQEKAKKILEYYLEQKDISGTITPRDFVSFRSKQLQEKIQTNTN